MDMSKSAIRDAYAGAAEYVFCVIFLLLEVHDFLAKSAYLNSIPVPSQMCLSLSPCRIVSISCARLLPAYSFFKQIQGQEYAIVFKMEMEYFY
jgi:hypothetical protein